MKDPRSLEKFVDTLFENDCLRLRRGFGIGLYLYNQLRDAAPPYILENLQGFDRMSLEKKKALLLELKSFLREYGYAQERKMRLKNSRSKPLKDFLVPLEKLRFIEGKEISILSKLGIRNLLDLLFFFPLRYEDRRIVGNLKLVRSGEKAVLRLKIKQAKTIKEGPYTAEVVCTDGSEEIKLRFRYKRSDFIPLLYRKGKEVLVSGKVRTFRGERYMVHPEEGV